MNIKLTSNVTIRKNKWRWAKLKALLTLLTIRLITEDQLLTWINTTSMKCVRFRIGHDGKWRWLNKLITLSS